MSEGEKQVSVNVPKCLGVIPDGNRRWARKRGLPTLEGHRRGSKKLRELLGWCEEVGIKNVVVYAFSTENWKRSEEEVKHLKGLLLNEVRKFAKEDDGKISLYFVGQVRDFGEDFAKELRDLEEKTSGREFHLHIALSYGGQAEILEGIKKLAREKTSEEMEALTESEFERHLWSAGMSEPDLIIRTSGEKRISGFMTWKSVYSELAFVDSYFPDFTKEEFFEVLQDYEKRERRRGR